MLPSIFPVTSHTKFVGSGTTFVAIKGFVQNGMKYIPQAIDMGANKIVFSNEIEFKKILKKLELNKYKLDKIKFIKVKNARKALAKLAAKKLNYPESKLKIIGVTGTKGKSTTVYLVEHILKTNGYKTALISSIKNKILDEEEIAINTTPESDYIQMFLSRCVKKNVDYVVMEVSSHAIALHRILGINFCFLGFTNLATEHMDFHTNMENYFYTKMKIFDQIKKGGRIIINVENYWGSKALGILKKNKKKINNQLITFDKSSLCKINTNSLIGQFNRYNITMSFLICKNIGISENDIKEAIKSFSGVPGRLQLHILKNKTKAFVDFAHNPSSMEAVLSELKKLTNNLIVVFGCGGNRDKTKRSIMGKIAEKYSNQIIITDDNPRLEKSKDIANDILKDIQQTENVYCEFDRKKAIKKAVEISTTNSIIAILGKGHENYYLIGKKKLHHNDYEEICKY
ncbi:UDP-N-acetylmuramoyl-L-alanyl-D-glutamate--2,6-diaminopimelate ligase [Candidatus Dependentiae bacterium]|nr:UDP-N-acetylmuramoyl-L-alanyl-D-glutamate--2,6-diaminopimelate ligase [Candidatus Dependentiae bacterium]